MNDHDHDRRAASGADEPGALPDALSSFEATLSALVPRQDRLDETTLWFEAGRQAGLAARPAAGRWMTIAGSSALSASLAIAATVLVMVWSRPEPRPLPRIQIVQAPAATTAAPEAAARTPSERRFGSSEEPRGEPPASAPAPADVPSILAASAPRGSRALELQTLDWMLRQGIDPWGIPATSPAATDTLAGELPTYIEQRQALLSESEALPPQRTPREPGAQS